MAVQKQEDQHEHTLSSYVRIRDVILKTCLGRWEGQGYPCYQRDMMMKMINMSSHLDCIFEIHQLWQSAFSIVYSNSCCSCWFEAEIIKIGQSSHKMSSNNILNFQEFTPILNACTKKVWKLIDDTTYSIKYNYCRHSSMVLSIPIKYLQSKYFLREINDNMRSPESENRL